MEHGQMGRRQTEPQISVHDWYYLGLLNVGGNYMVNGKSVVASRYFAAWQNEPPGGEDGQCEDVVAGRMDYILGQLNRFMCFIRITC
ncbi:hypothetical protein AB4Y42_40840 [Paraburkholderia sp. EG286B]|uniref:hypothetical protein n=1 Tax=Paraburkholderia sp. EG286B TaxID=3237011 RepID=UPI0034D368F3